MPRELSAGAVAENRRDPTIRDRFRRQNRAGTGCHRCEPRFFTGVFRGLRCGRVGLGQNSSQPSPFRQCVPAVARSARSPPLRRRLRPARLPIEPKALSQDSTSVSVSGAAGLGPSVGRACCRANRSRQDFLIPKDAHPLVRPRLLAARCKRWSPPTTTNRRGL